MELIRYIFWVIAVPLFLAFLWVKVLKMKTWIIISIEAAVVSFLTFIGIIENNPTGNMQRQLSSYFGRITNDFYLRYLPLIIVTILFIRLFKKGRLKTN